MWVAGTPQRHRCGECLRSLGIQPAERFGKHIGTNRPGRDRIDSNAIRAFLLRKDPGERIERALRYCVGAVGSWKSLRNIGGNVDDVASSLRTHVRQDCLHQMKWAIQVGSDNAIPFRCGRVGQRNTG